MTQLRVASHHRATKILGDEECLERVQALEYCASSWKNQQRQHVIDYCIEADKTVLL